MNNTGINPIAIPTGADGVIAAYEGATITQIVIKTLGTGDLILYDNATAASGNVLAVIPHGGSTGVTQVNIKCSKGIYASATAVWVGTIWLGG